MTSADSESTYDFDLHGVVGVRLVDARADDLAMVSRQLGPIRRAFDRRPDITVRFVDSATASDLTYVGLGDTGFNEDGFFVLRRGASGALAKARMPFDHVGEHPELLCERALPLVPHLLALINLTALTKGVLPLHATAFSHGSTGVLVTGWSKGGKTEALLAAMEAGESYIGDEWVYLKPDGQMLGLPEPIRLWDWHLQQFPALLRDRSRKERTRLAAWRATGSATQIASVRWGLAGAGIARKAAPVVNRQAFVQVPPVDLFGHERVVLRGTLGSVVMVMSSSAPLITTRAAGPTEVSDRMAASLEDERSPILNHYRQFRYATPGRRSVLIEKAAEHEARLLSALFDGRPATVVTHPHPCDIRSFGSAVLRAAETTLDSRRVEVPS